VRSIGWMTYSAAVRCLSRRQDAARPAGNPRPLTERNRVAAPQIRHSPSLWSR